MLIYKLLSIYTNIEPTNYDKLQNTKLKSKNQNLEKNAVTWNRNTLHKITLLVFPNLKLKSKML